MGMETIDRLGRPHVSPYSEAVRTATFDLWCSLGQQDADLTAKMLQTDPIWREAAELQPGDRAPDATTIRRWVANENWLTRFQRNMQMLAPASVATSALTLIHSAPAAAQTIAQIASSDRHLTQSDRIKLQAAQYVITSVIGDRIHEFSQPVVESTLKLGNLAELTMEELAEQERMIIEKKVV